MLSHFLLTCSHASAVQQTISLLAWLNAAEMPLFLSVTLAQKGHLT